MAFLCLGRRRRQSEDQVLPPPPAAESGCRSSEFVHEGRANCSMVVKHTFVPCSQDELEVMKGQRVFFMYQDHEWVYVRTEHGNKGFVPFNYLTCEKASGPKLKHDPAPHRNKDQCLNNLSSNLSEGQRRTVLHDQETNRLKMFTANCAAASQSEVKSSNSSKSSQGTATSGYDSDSDSSPFGEADMINSHLLAISNPSMNDITDCLNTMDNELLMIDESFERHSHGRFLVLHTFNPINENDVQVLKGDCVTVLNEDDNDWYWVQTSDLRQGFVPRSFLWQATCSPADPII